MRHSGRQPAFDEVAWLRAEFTKTFGAERLRRADEQHGMARVDQFLLLKFQEVLIQGTTALLDGRVDVSPMTEDRIAALEDDIVADLDRLRAEPELAQVPVAELMLRLQGAILRSMRRSLRQAGADRRRASSRAVPPLVEEFEKRRRSTSQPESKTARGLLAERDPAWLSGSDEDRTRKIGSLLRTARRWRDRRKLGQT